MLEIDDEQYLRIALTQAHKCKSEPGKASPLVGAVAVKDGQVIGTAYRGENKPGEHAEYTLLEGQFSKVSLAGATIYTTLEPCTTRNHPKICCAERLIERKVKRVVIGTLDPNPKITGKGLRLLQKHNIEVALCSTAAIVNEIEEINRDFNRAQAESKMESRTSFADRADPAYVKQRDEIRNICRRYKQLTLIGRDLFDSGKALDAAFELARRCDSYQLLLADPTSQGYSYRYNNMEPSDPDVQGTNPGKLMEYRTSQAALANRIHQLGGDGAARQVRWYTELPIFHIEVMDNTMFVAFYGYKSRAKYSPIVRIEKKDSPILFQYFMEQFENYWRDSATELK